LAWLDTSIVLRALAITMVVVVHLEIWGYEAAHTCCSASPGSPLPASS
jgi:hypothetical protein